MLACHFELGEGKVSLLECSLTFWCNRRVCCSSSKMLRNCVLDVPLRMKSSEKPRPTVKNITPKTNPGTVAARNF